MKYGLPDLNDGKRWSETDIEDLKGAVAYGRTLEEAATFLCRGGPLEDVCHQGGRAVASRRPRKPV
jgi:hypothetical protein